MNFEFSEDQLFIRDQARNMLSQECSTQQLRESLEGSREHSQQLWQQVVELGWPGMAIPEEFGGLGLGYLELCVIAEELGRVAAPIPFSSSVYLATEALKLFGSEEQKAQYLPRLANGEIVGGLAFAEGPGYNYWSTSAVDDSLSGSKWPVGDGDSVDFVIATASDAQGQRSLYLVDLNEDVNRQALTSLDDSRAQTKLSFDKAQAARLGQAGDGEQQLAQLFDLAAVLLAFEQVGGAQAALDMGIAYTKDRYAFGRPVASFQAIKHKFADMFVAIELARSNAYYGAWALSNDAADLPLAAATARVSATDAFYLASKENIQAHGGMGFTWEFDCHLYYRRAQLLSNVIGGQTYWQEQLASRLLQAA